ncbi:alginate lyase family protein [Algibacter mikhailovii]|uniref:alginate lyase family protein n=1 Tax=Algibacter mikhailovii TaxID=425498 RepID=UPI0024955F0C|nr:alginate lyase family protein [Algibacter mikhailovii]
MFEAKIHNTIHLFLVLLIMVATTACQDQPKVVSDGNALLEHPNLVSTAKGMALIKNNLGKYPLIDHSIQDMKGDVDAEILKAKDFPIPKDPSGGYTHEKHKRNYLTMYRAGMLFQVLGDAKYGHYVKDMLLGYAELIPTLGLHPNGKSYSPGKLFWQGLNDAMWLIHIAQAYDCVYYLFTDEERARVKQNVLKNMGDFLSVGSPKMFNRVHNHGIWLNAAVGLTGYTLKDDVLIKRALYGAEIDKTLETFKTVDYNDPALKGFDENRPAGYYMQLDNLFSPDGFFTEGPYYQRFSIWPFMLMAQAIENNDPSIKIFEYRDAILKKALYTALQLSYTDGAFFPFNDALKGMDFTSPELTLALDIVYQNYDEDPQLLDVAIKQNQVVFSEGGFKVAKHVSENKAIPFTWKSINLGDGADGKQGGVAILRSGPSSDQLCQIMRYTSHGLAHGHYDKLGQALYDNGNEILQDYGASRWVAVITKRGGRYLPENTTWAKQTIAHNTLVVDEKSQFNGDINVSSKYHSELYFYDDSQDTHQVISAKENNAYPGIQMHRTFAMITDSRLLKPFVLDVFNIESDSKHQLDLPFHYKGEIMNITFDHKVMTDQLQPLGDKNGYQHLWLLGKGKTKDAQAKFTWLNDGRFYTITTIADSNTEFLLCRLGANDPEFNLRPDPSFIIRQKAAKNHTFVSIVEPHGSKSLTREIVTNPYGSIKTLEIVYQDANYIAVDVLVDTEKLKVILALNDNDSEKEHDVIIADKSYQWQGPFMKVFQSE